MMANPILPIFDDTGLVLLVVLLGKDHVEV